MFVGSGMELKQESLCDVKIPGHCPKTSTAGETITMGIHTNHIVRNTLYDDLKNIKEIRIEDRLVSVSPEGKRLRLKVYEKALKNAKGTVLIELKNNILSSTKYSTRA